MSRQLPETLQDIQDAIHSLTSSDPDTPLPSDDQWKVRLRYINRAIAKWARQDVEWRELFAVSSPVTIAAGQSVYPIGNDDFRAMASLLRIHQNNMITYIDVLKPQQMIKYQGTGQVAYLTGNPRDGYNLNLGWTPKAGDQFIGATFDFDYWTTADNLSDPTDIPQMSNPDFIVYWAAAQELLFNERENLAEEYFEEADDAMDNMKITNEMMPAYASMKLDDIEVVRDSDIWGE